MAPNSGTDKPTEGMVDYNQNSSPQQHDVQRNSEAISDLARRVSAQSAHLSITDYGCGPGQSTVDVIKPAIAA